MGAVNPLNPFASVGGKSASCHSPFATISNLVPFSTLIPVEKGYSEASTLISCPKLERQYDSVKNTNASCANCISDLLVFFIVLNILLSTPLFLLEMFLRLLAISLLVLGSLTGQAERIVFDMSVFGFKFGEMVLTRTVVNDSIEKFTLNAKGKTDFLWMKREEESIFNVEYRNGTLFSSDYEYLNKGKVEKWSTIRFDGSEYIVKSNEGDRTFKEPLDYSLIKLYFEPTIKRTTVFCEEDCTYAEMIPDQKNNKVLIECQDGSRSTYHVKDGRVVAMEIHLAVATVKLTRVN